jgi:biotin operon repressor
MNDRSDYPRDRAGHRGLGGSVEAADVITPARPALWHLIMKQVEAAGENGVTGDEIAAALGWDKYRVRPRTAELRKLGWIIDSRQRRRSQSGILSIVWVLPIYSRPLDLDQAA